ncbi:MAG: BON domain-containing protein [Planctomycetaceae bacterium]|nr:BON domain-containing protein [Planctomycetaceae bacterium]
MRLSRPNQLLASFLIAFVLAFFSGQRVLTAQPTERLDDREIALGVETELLKSEAVASHKVDTTCDNSIVTLAGKVDNLLARQAAFEIAQRVRGVESVINQIVVITDDREDDQILKDLENAFQASDALENSDIQLDVKFSTAKLTGTVQSQAERHLAEQIARGVKGLVDIDNQLTLNDTHQRPDTEIREELNRLFQSDALLSDSKLDVLVEKGKVTLTGFVPTSAAKSRAEQFAAHSGAKVVDVRGIQVDYDRYDGIRRRSRLVDLTDDKIRDTVELALRYDPRVLSYLETIEVTSEGGTVTLSGEVGRLRAKESAEETARGTLGVWRVKNRLKVRYPDEEPTAREIIDYVQSAFQRDPYVSRHEIRVHCRNGHVSLYGLVDTSFEKKAAGWISGAQKGVVHVNNYLSVAKEWVPKPDAEIKADIEEKLLRTFFDKSNQIDVTVEDGVAILRGEVDTWRQWQTAMEEVIQAGARRPHNLLDVRYHPQHGGSDVYVPQ